jgi:hypothetical protein
MTDVWHDDTSAIGNKGGTKSAEMYLGSVHVALRIDASNKACYGKYLFAVGRIGRLLGQVLRAGQHRKDGRGR